jgi:beta-galactosidase
MNRSAIKKFSKVLITILVILSGSAFVFFTGEPLLVSANKDSEIQSVNPDQLQTGIAYYPEREAEELWPLSYQKIKQAGIKRIRIGEFAWSALEPDEDVFNFEWLDRCIALAATFDIQVVLCTPTAAPPIWLVEKYPDVLPVNEAGYQSPFGCRQHRCYNSLPYQQYSFRIVEQMAKRYGNNPSVVAWQIDNEFGGEQKFCYCASCDKAFSEFLAGKYKSISELNKRWINAFWSQDYQRFEQIKTPKRYQATLWIKHHPSLELEFYRFCSASIEKFSAKQAEILRRYIRNQLITTNRSTFAWGDNLNWYSLSQPLDIAGFDLYSDKPHEIAFYADFNRSLCTANSWFMEYDVGSHNLIEEMKLLQSHGVDWLFFFKLKPFPAGQEQSTGSLLTITGENTPGYGVVRDWNSGHFKSPAFQCSQPVGLVYDFESSWVYSLQSWGDYTDRLIYQDYLINTVYRSLFMPGNPVAILPPITIPDTVKILIVPRLILHRSGFEQELVTFLQNGGNLLVTSDLFLKNEDNVYLTKLPEIYTRVFRVTDNNFIRPDEKSPVILKRVSYGKGEAIMLNENASMEEWQHLISEIKGLKNFIKKEP